MKGGCTTEHAIYYLDNTKETLSKLTVSHTNVLVKCLAFVNASYVEPTPPPPPLPPQPPPPSPTALPVSPCSMTMHLLIVLLSTIGGVLIAGIGAYVLVQMKMP